MVAKSSYGNGLNEAVEFYGSGQFFQQFGIKIFPGLPGVGFDFLDGDHGKMLGEFFDNSRRVFFDLFINSLMFSRIRSNWSKKLLFFIFLILLLIPFIPRKILTGTYKD